MQHSPHLFCHWCLNIHIQADFISISLRVAIINAIMTVSMETTLAYMIIAHSCLKSSILMSNTLWQYTNWWSRGVFTPSGNLNATLTCSISFAITSAQKVLPFLTSRVNACSSVLVLYQSYGFSLNIGLAFF